MSLSPINCDVGLVSYMYQLILEPEELQDDKDWKPSSLPSVADTQFTYNYWTSKLVMPKRTYVSTWAQEAMGKRGTPTVAKPRRSIRLSEHPARNMREI